MNDNPDRDLEAEAARQTVLVEWTAQLRRDLAESFEGTILRGARPIMIGAGGTLRPLTSPGTLMGFSLHNLTGASGVVDLWDGGGAADDDDGLLVAISRLGGDLGNAQWFGPAGISLSRGLHVTTSLAGGQADFRGCVYIRGSE